MNEWHLGPLLEFLTTEADPEELSNVTSVVLRLVPNYNDAGLKQLLRVHSVRPAHVSDLPKVSHPENVLCGARVHHHIKENGIVIFENCYF